VHPVSRAPFLFGRLGLLSLDVFVFCCVDKIENGRLGLLSLDVFVVWIKIKKEKRLEMRGIEPRASRMQSERSTI
jgi:hypothetical protein